MMAIRKEPERRYSSIAQFLSDIGAYLNGYPLLARTDTLGLSNEFLSAPA